MRYAAAALSLFALRLVAAKQIDVTVGGVKDGAVQLLFSPEAVFADVGDVVKFTFKAKNHTATQGSFDGPCTPLAGGFNSGFHAATVDQADGFDTVEFNVVDTKPTWFHCAATGHCGKGMVFAINCGADDAPNSFSNFKKSALAIGAAQASTTAGGGGAAPPGSTTVYGTYTVPPEPSVETVTATISVENSMWTTVYPSYDGSGDPAPTSLTGAVHKVLVGSGGLIFDPPFVAAAPRDTIMFEFHAKNHTVTQSSFANPCKKLDVSADSGLPGLDSGFQPVATDATTFPVWNVTVNSTAPIYFYCKQRTGNHCGEGMVFAVNTDEEGPRNYAAFKGLAKTINGTSAAANSPQPTTGAAGPRAALGSSIAALALVAGAAAILL